MIDLYRRIGARGPHDTAGIERALQDPRVAPELRRLASFIIGDPERKAVHDAAWTTVTVVARLRALMLLELTPLWTDAELQDFSASAGDASRARHCLPVDRGHPHGRTGAGSSTE